MSIIKPSTSKIMKVLTDATNQAESLQEDVANTRDKIGEKLKIIDYQMEYAIQSLHNMDKLDGILKDKIVFSAVEKYGSFDSYGITIHPKFAKSPRNIFNFHTSQGYIYKNNIETTMNGSHNDDVNEWLKHDSTAKEFVIREYVTDELTVEIKPNQNNTMGSLTFNMIEIAPYLPGSFHIESIEIYERGNDTTPVQSISNLAKVGAQRIIFDDKTALGRAVFKIRLLYKNAENKYIFGLKHLYFLEADFQKDSYVIVRADKNQNISYVYDDIVMKDQFGVDLEYSANSNDIMFYSTYNGSVLSNRIETSTTLAPSYIPVNIKSVFIRIPITTSLISIIPDIRVD